MKRTISSIFAAAAVATASAVVSVTPGDVSINSLNVEREGNGLSISFVIDASQIKMKSNEEVIVVPEITDGNQSVQMSPVTVAGRNRMYYHLRNDEGYVRGENLYHNGKDASYISYSGNVPYRQWMNLSQLRLTYTYGGCANCSVSGSAEQPLATIDMRPAFFDAEYVYTRPKSEGIKSRKESGSAYVDFPVNVSDIDPEFRNNASELAKISQTIDRVRNDRDYTITSIFIKGYASPEGPYDHNEKLAKGRTESLVGYVRDSYSLPRSVKFTSAYEAEDWTGLRKWVETSDLESRDGILAIIDDTTLTPDEKDARIKRDFPEEYPFLLKNVYPTLRHSDYTVNYTVREFTDVQQIVGLVRTAPQKLGLNEFYLASETFTPGSDEFNEVFETAVRMYPDDEVANLNAANAAMSRGDMVSARKYLDKAGNSGASNYARGVYEALNKNFEAAIRWFDKAKGVPQAVEAAKQARLCIERPEGKVIVTEAK
ncbi:MAG TPA: hypothetical protein DC009_06685 [Porphyromonadaceae bacterium]|nr:hypothetical protein [Porphyromonadaceae bacterium]